MDSLHFPFPFALIQNSWCDYDAVQATTHNVAILAGCWVLLQGRVVPSSISYPQNVAVELESSNLCIRQGWEE
jgi:hypothetical protein